MIHGIGIDIVDVEKFRGLMERRGQRFLDRLFTPAETAYCLRQRRPHEHLAGRFAAKMSLVKAVGRGFRFKDVEVVRGKDGRPEIRAVGLGDRFTITVSISHDGGYAVAQTIVEVRSM